MSCEFSPAKKIGCGKKYINCIPNSSIGILLFIINKQYEYK